ncbi:MAG: aspartate aminotransferase family protein [Solirubrobacterales bacterium]
MPELTVEKSSSNVLPPELHHTYPLVVRGEGVWVDQADGTRYLDAMSGGSMAATIGLGRRDVVDAARKQAEQLSFVHNEWLTNPAQERLARRLVELAPEYARVSFVTGGAEANETALRLARSYHLERGDEKRWRIISPAQAYHGPTFATLALTGRAGLKGPLAPYLPEVHHIPPCTRQLDPTGEEALAALDRLIEELGADTICAYYCEGVSAASLPAYTPPDSFWEGLAERRDRHGFLVCFDEIVTGLGRTGSWFAAEQLPIQPDILATAKGLGGGYAAIGAVLSRAPVYEAIAAGSGQFALGHTWNGAPLSCAVANAVLDVLEEEELIDRVRINGPLLRDRLEAALADISIVQDVRGHGYLLGVEYGDPREPDAFLPPALRVAARIDAGAMRRQLITLSTQPTSDGYAGDQSLFAPAFVSSDSELEDMVERFAAAVREVDAEVTEELDGSRAGAAE